MDASTSPVEAEATTAATATATATTTATTTTTTTTTEPSTSDWDEPATASGLTLYELEREPRALRHGPDVRVSLEGVSDDIVCPVCLDFMEKTVLVNACGHRFCTNCIETSLRTHKNECPKCREHIPSRRSLRADENFDKLIRMLRPRVKAYQDSVEKRREEERKRAGVVVPSSSTLGTATTGAESSAAKRVRTAPTTASGANGPTAPPGRGRRAEQVQFILRRYPEEAHTFVVVRQEYLSTSSMLTVGHLKTFLEACAARNLPTLALTRDSFEFVYSDTYGDEIEVREESATVGDLMRRFRPEDGDLVLHYRVIVAAAPHPS